MDPFNVEQSRRCHVVAMPYPGRGHINPMLNFCKQLSSRSDDILLSFVVTEEWLSLIDAGNKPGNMRFVSISNVLPSEKVRGADMLAFLEAVFTKIEGPFEQLLDRIEPPATTIIADTYLPWAVSVGNQRNIPVASFWPMSAMMFSIFHHFHLLVENGHFPVVLSERGEEIVDYIPGISSMRIVDLPQVGNRELMELFVAVVPRALKAQYLLFATLNELEPQAIDLLRSKFASPIYAVVSSVISASIAASASDNDHNYLHWLDSQPKSSVLYISFGSYLLVSSEQMEEITAALRDSGVRYLWVARGEISRLQESCGDKGLVVPWCDQLRVLSHSSIGGFWSHCGWNSTKEGVFAGVPFLTFPQVIDQIPNSKLIVEDWKVGWRMKKEMRREIFVTRAEVKRVVQGLMDSENDEVKEMRARAKELQQICLPAIQNGGSSETCLDAFIRDISK